MTTTTTTIKNKATLEIFRRLWGSNEEGDGWEKIGGDERVRLLALDLMAPGLVRFRGHGHRGLEGRVTTLGQRIGAALFEFDESDPVPDDEPEPVMDEPEPVPAKRTRSRRGPHVAGMNPDAVVWPEESEGSGQ
jgi:hypothetical protein